MFEHNFRLYWVMYVNLMMNENELVYDFEFQLVGNDDFSRILNDNSMAKMFTEISHCLCIIQ